MDKIYDDDDDALAVLTLLSKGLMRKKMKRTVWVKGWLLKRNSLGAYNALVRELAVSDSSCYRNFLRMSDDSFYLLLQKVGTYTQFQHLLILIIMTSIVILITYY